MNNEDFSARLQLIEDKYEAKCKLLWQEYWVKRELIEDEYRASKREKWSSQLIIAKLEEAKG